MGIFRPSTPAVHVPHDWPHIGSTSQTDFYWNRDGVMLAVPIENSVDDAKSAVANSVFQKNWAIEHGPFALIVLIDQLDSQDRDARNIYAAMGPETLKGVALVGGTMLSRAIASFFLGIAKPNVEFRLFGSIDEALRWFDGG